MFAQAHLDQLIMQLEEVFNGEKISLKVFSIYTISMVVCFSLKSMDLAKDLKPLGFSSFPMDLLSY